ncbi:MAG: translation elongation factor Ts [Patescibacteria group bacterium]|nr:translation elongation factor Ts [Patescibacteria group bacterium]
MSVDISAVKNLRDRTGVSVVECKKALEESGGDLDKAIEALKARGAAVAQKKSGRTLGAGAIGNYVHSDGNLGALVELACETDFVAKNEDFRTLANDLAMQVAAFSPEDNAALLALPFIREQGSTVDQVIKGYLQKFGERLELIRFVRLVVGEDA